MREYSIGISSVDGVAIGGIIHKPFSNETLWSFGERKNTALTFLMIMDQIRYRVWWAELKSHV